MIDYQFGMHALRRKSHRRNKDCRIKVYRKAFFKEIRMYIVMICTSVIFISAIFYFNNIRFGEETYIRNDIDNFNSTDCKITLCKDISSIHSQCLIVE
jgi:hypothetical protein